MVRNEKKKSLTILKSEEWRYITEILSNIDICSFQSFGSQISNSLPSSWKLVSTKFWICSLLGLFPVFCNKKNELCVVLGKFLKDQKNPNLNNHTKQTCINSLNLFSTSFGEVLIDLSTNVLLSLYNLSIWTTCLKKQNN